MTATPTLPRPVEEWGPETRGYDFQIDPEELVMGGLRCVDVEDDEQGNFVGMGMSDPAQRKRVTYHASPVPANALRRIYGHNIKSDVLKLWKWGYINIKPEDVTYDTILASALQDNRRPSNALTDLAREILGRERPSYEELTGKGKHHKTFVDMPIPLVAAKCGCDVIDTLELKRYFDKALSPQEKDYLETLEFPTLRALMRMEERGVCVNKSVLASVGSTIAGHSNKTEKLLRQFFGATINLRSPVQVLEAIKVSTGRTPREHGKASTSEAALQPLKHFRQVQLLLKYREYQKLLSTYIAPLLAQPTNKVHTTFSLHGTVTGRLSSKTPNLQNIPVHGDMGPLIRSAFVPSPGQVFWDGDFSAIEPRMMAHMSQDPALLEIFNSGKDFHEETARRLSLPRFSAKVLNLSIGYRVGAQNVARQLDCSVEEAQKEMDKWWAAFPELLTWEEGVLDAGRRQGYVTTIFGRKLRTPNLLHGNRFRREAAEREAINNITQGSAAEVVKMAMIALDKAGFRLLLQVHDELLGESCSAYAASEAEHAKEIMESCAPSLSVPLVVKMKTGLTWAQVH